MSLLDRLNPYAFWLELAAAAALLAMSFGAGWTTNGWRLGSELATVRAEHAQADALGARADLTQTQQAAARVTEAASQAAASVDAARARFAALKASYAKPLPSGCRPDDERLRRRNAAIDAYNAARAGSVSSP